MTLVLLHEQFETVDDLFGRSQFVLDMKARRAFVISATTLGCEHRFLRAEERSQIGGQRCKTGGINGGRWHIRKLSSRGAVRNKSSAPESVRRSWCCDDPFAHTLPVQPVKQRFELHPRQMHDAAADLRPLKTASATKALVD